MKESPAAFSSWNSLSPKRHSDFRQAGRRQRPAGRNPGDSRAAHPALLRRKVTAELPPELMPRFSRTDTGISPMSLSGFVEKMVWQAGIQSSCLPLFSECLTSWNGCGVLPALPPEKPQRENREKGFPRRQPFSEARRPYTTEHGMESRSFSTAQRGRPGRRKEPMPVLCVLDR